MCLVFIPTVDEALHNLSTFYFVAVHLFYAGGIHATAISEILRFIERIEELYTEVHGITTYLTLPQQ